jgi:hypothetical protein
VTHQRPSQLSFQLWWGRAFRLFLRFVFAVWIVAGSLGALMSILLDPIGVLLGGIFAVVGFFGWRATRRPFHEWRLVNSWLKGAAVPNISGPPASPPTQNSGSSEVSTPPRPNKSLERTREG